MSKFRVSIAAAVGVLAIAGSLLVAPAASADLCGYPPVQCPAGNTNPPQQQSVGGSPAAQAQSGMKLPDQATADQTPPTKPADPPSVNAIGDAPKIPAARGDVVKVKTDVKPATTYRVKVKRNDGVYNFVGTVTANADGGVTLPAIQLDRKGTYTFALEDGAGSTFYVKVVVD